MKTIRRSQQWPVSATWGQQSDLTVHPQEEDVKLGRCVNKLYDQSSAWTSSWWSKAGPQVIINSNSQTQFDVLLYSCYSAQLKCFHWNDLSFFYGATFLGLKPIKRLMCQCTWSPSRAGLSSPPPGIKAFLDLESDPEPLRPAARPLTSPDHFSLLHPSAGGLRRRPQTPVSRSRQVWGWLLGTPGSIATAAEPETVAGSEMVSGKQGASLCFYTEVFRYLYLSIFYCNPVFLWLPAGLRPRFGPSDR